MENMENNKHTIMIGYGLYVIFLRFGYFHNNNECVHLKR